jgi:type III pantothenate kinase
MRLMPPLIAVDIGNSSTKLGSFALGLELHSAQLPSPTTTWGFNTGLQPPIQLATELPTERCLWHIASVNRDGTRLLASWLGAQRPNDEVHLLTYRDLPISLQVDFPDRVGLDRLAAAVATNAIRHADRPAIVIDAGSAITVDLVTAQGAFAGGVILPGFGMSAEALYGGADLLPLAMLAPNDQPPDVVGKNTEGAIRSGLFWGAVGAVREIVARMSADLIASDRSAPPEVFITGGDLRQLANYIEGARFIPNLVLSGIALAATRHRLAT